MRNSRNALMSVFLVVVITGSVYAILSRGNPRIRPSNMPVITFTGMTDQEVARKEVWCIYNGVPRTSCDLHHPQPTEEELSHVQN